jgi:hypothetical protein
MWAKFTLKHVIIIYKQTLCLILETISHYAAQSSLELVILLPQLGFQPLTTDLCMILLPIPSNKKLQQSLETFQFVI